MNDISNLQNNAIGYNNDKIKNRNKKLIIILTIIGIIIVVAIAVFLFLKTTSKQDTRYIGEWECNEGVSLSMKDNTFEMIYPTATISGTYEVKEINEKDMGKYFTIDFNANKRVINDSTYNSPYTTQFELGFAEDDSMSMINVISYSIYTCKRKS